jgi:glycosyltransferase involved in cell wall biosynthesis
MAVVTAVEVALAEVDSERLLGSNIEAPQPGLRTDGHELDLTGWVLGRHSPAVAVEVMHGGTVVRRAPVEVRRSDVAAAFPEAPAAQRSGFRTRVGVAGMGELELRVQAVLRDQSRVPLGTIRARRRWREGDYEAGAALVSVVIPCRDQAHFLGEAIESVLAQTYPHFEVVVVDDGSSDNTEEVAARYPGVRCVRQENRGLAAARNTGIRRSHGGHLVFLDADDRLLPVALEAGLGALKAHPECAFVAGRYRYIGFDGSPLPTPQPPRVERDHYPALLSDNFIKMHATVMYQRPVFEYVKGFDSSVSPADDYDLYLRIAGSFPIRCHERVVTEIRQENQDISDDNCGSRLISTLAVLHSQQRRIKDDNRYGEPVKTGVGVGRTFYGEQLAKVVRVLAQEREWKQMTQGVMALLRYYPRGLVSALRSLPEGTGFGR